MSTFATGCRGSLFGGMLYVWNFDASERTGALLGLLPAAPQFMMAPGALPDGARTASWIDWVDSNRIAIATAGGDVLVFNAGMAVWKRRLDGVMALGERLRADARSIRLTH